MPIKIDYTGDPREFLAATGKTTEALDATAAKLEEVGDAGDRSGQAAADGLGDVAAAADDATAATDDLGDAQDKASTKGGSFVESLKSGLLGVAAVAGGVAGIVTTVLGKAVDFVTDQINKQIKAADEMKAALVTAYQDAGAAGDVYLSKAQVTANALAILNDPVKGPNAARDASAIGVDTNTYIRAQAGDYEALKTVIEATKRAKEELDARPPSPADYEARAQAQTLNNIIQQNKTLLDLHDQGQKNAEQAIQITNEIAAAELDRIEKTKTADQERYEGIAAQIEQLDGKSVEIPTKFSVDKTEVENYIADLQRKRITIPADVVDRLTGQRLP